MDYGACLENRCGFAPTVGSNPSPSAYALRGDMAETIEWGGARVVDWGRLLSGCWVKTQPGVRIPPSPPFKWETRARAWVFLVNIMVAWLCANLITPILIRGQ